MVASATGDERAAAAAFDDAMSFPVRFEWRRAPVHVRLDAASLLILEERWHDALTVLENITANELPPNQKPVHQNNLAYVLAHVGRSDDATRLAQPLFDELPAEHGVHRFALHTLATAHLVGGRPREAAEVLRELATSPAARAIEAFTYGEALRELGDVDGARAALLRSVDLGLKGRQLARARERLQALGAYR
jgi:Flp pilus assembly protein TadD